MVIVRHRSSYSVAPAFAPPFRCSGNRKPHRPFTHRPLAHLPHCNPKATTNDESFAVVGLPMLPLLFLQVASENQICNLFFQLTS